MSTILGLDIGTEFVKAILAKPTKKGKLEMKPHMAPKESIEAVGRIFTRYQERANRQGVRA